MIPTSYAQIVIPINQTEPCFLNYTAGINMWRNCGYDVDYIDAALLPFEWVTGLYLYYFHTSNITK